MLYADGRTYMQEGDVLVGTAAANPGQTTRYALPTWEADPTAGEPLYLKAMVPADGTGTVAGLVRTGQAHLVVLSFTGLAAGASDLDTGRKAPLRGYSVLGGVCLGADGRIYAVGWRYADPRFTLRILAIDPSTLAVVGTYDTGLTPATTDNVESLPVQGSGALVLVAQGNAGSSQVTRLWIVGANGTTSGPALPANAGLYMSPAAPGSVYLFGGSAGSHVAKLTLVTGALQDLANLDAPPGTYVLAVADPNG
ncbi:MAG: hypothetical protein ACRDOD_12320 [Streptosporangiaceae bacterium]